MERFINGDICIKCETIEELKEFLNKCEKENLKWKGGQKATDSILLTKDDTMPFYIVCKNGKLLYQDEFYKIFHTILNIPSPLGEIIKYKDFSNNIDSKKQDFEKITISKQKLDTIFTEILRNINEIKESLYKENKKEGK